MDPLADKTLSFLENLETHRSIDALIAEFARTLRAFGFTHCIMSRVPTPDDPDTPYALAHALPGKWLARYREQDYVWHDPIASYPNVNGGLAFTWNEARARARVTRTAQKIASEGKEFGMIDGMVFPTSDPKNAQAIVNIVTDRPVDLDPAHMALLQQLCQRAELRAFQLVHNAIKPRLELSSREQQALEWIAKGKIDWEAAVNLVDGRIRKQ